MCSYVGFCSPYCGKCKPPKQKPVECPVCGKYNNAGLENCVKCGTPVPKVVPIALMCSYIGMMCGNPCGKRTLISCGYPKVCRYHTSVRDESE